MSNIKALVFDLYGTLVSIRTDEHDPVVFQEISKFLTYNKVYIGPDELHDFYHNEIKGQLGRAREEYPEIDVYRLFTLVAVRYGSDRVDLNLPMYTAKLFRSLTRKQFEVFPGAFAMLERLHDRYPMALLSDAQRCFSEAEIDTLKLTRFFDHIFLSSDYGFRKPDSRYFRIALDSLKVNPEEAVYIGDSHFRDLFGAKNAGMKMVLVRSTEGGGDYNGIKADAVIEDVAKLEEVLDGLNGEMAG